MTHPLAGIESMRKLGLIGGLVLLQIRSDDEQRHKLSEFYAATPKRL